jgi:hypothetical protein
VAKTNEDEVVVIQETGFNIRIIAPGVEQFDLPVSVYCNIICLSAFFHLSRIIDIFVKTRLCQKVEKLVSQLYGVHHN